MFADAVRAWVDVATIEAQVVGVDVTARCRRPIVAVRATTVERGSVNAAGINEIVGEMAMFPGVYLTA